MEMTPKMFKAVSLLYEGKSKKEIAEELKISAATLGRWLNDPDFKAATVSVASQQIGQLVPDAVQTIQRVMFDDMAKPAERLNAARTVLEYARVLDREEMDREITVRVEYV